MTNLFCVRKDLDQKFSHYKFNQAPTGLQQDYVYALHYDSTADVVWIGLGGRGLQKLDLNNNSFLHFSIPPIHKDDAFYANVVRDLHLKNDTLWIGTFNGLKAFSTTRSEFIDLTSSFSLFQLKDWCFAIAEVRNDLWLGMSAEDMGISMRSGKFIGKKFSTAAISGRDLNDANVNAILYHPPFVWIGTNNGGINVIDLRSENLNVDPIKHLITEGKIKTIHEGIDGTLYTGGLSGLVAHKNGTSEIIYDQTVNVCKVKDQWIAIGTNTGLVLKDRKKKAEVRFQYNKEDSLSLSHNIIRAIHFDTLRNILWTLTEAGLCSVDLSTKKTRRHSYPKASASKFLFMGDSIVIATSRGVKIFNIAERRYKPLHPILDKMLVGIVNDINIGAGGDLLIASDKGMIQISSTPDKKLRILTQADGLPSDQALAVQQDGAGRYRLSTSKGLCMLQPSGDSLLLRLIDKQDGLQSSVFSSAASLKKRNGHLVFGSVRGMIEFDPYTINIEKTARTPVILSIESSIPEIKEYVNGDASIKTFIQLPYSVNSLSLAFSNLDYASGNKSRYAYRLLPDGQTWTSAISSHPQAVFTNLPHGDYIFQVKATNRDGVWSDIRELKISILPPPWKTTWAYVAYAILLAAAIWLARKNIIGRERLKSALKLEHVKSEKLKEVNEFKSRFFANISHEFRTPLTLIRGQAEELLRKKIILQQKYWSRSGTIVIQFFTWSTRCSISRGSIQALRH